jgi:hypothetical protein
MHRLSCQSGRNLAGPGRVGHSLSGTLQKGAILNTLAATEKAPGDGSGLTESARV